MPDKGESTPWWNPILRFAVRSDIGMRRTNNQDSHKEVPAATPRLWRTRGHLFVVADGMGAHAAGELASQMATDIIAGSYLKRTEDSPYEALTDAVMEAHQKIKRQGDEDDAFRNMGTTVDALVLLPEGAFIAHVGDSRVYRLRAGMLEQLTFDHSLVWEVRRLNRVTPDNIPVYLPKNVITRSLGPTQHLQIDREGPLPIFAGDTYLLCTDGLSGQVSDAELAQILSLFSPKEGAESLINLANLRGGPDNTTLCIINVLGIPEPETVEKKSESGYVKRPPMTLGGWLAFAVAIVFALLVPMAFQGSALGAHWAAWRIGAIFGFAAALTLFLFTARKTLFFSTEPHKIPTPFGHAPYTKAAALPTSEFAQKLRRLAEQLQPVAQVQAVLVNRDVLDRLATESERAFEDQLFGDAITASMTRINRLMAALKRRHDGGTPRPQSEPHPVPTENRANTDSAPPSEAGPLGTP